jgi:Domain of unknown function (DUF3883)
MANEPSPREELILEVLRAASDRISIQDFDIQCQLAPSTSGKSYYDRLRVAEKLIDEGIIEKIDDHLRIVAKIAPTWLKEGLLSGSAISWEILEAIDTKGKIQGKIDLELLATIGLEGEKEVISQLKKALPSQLVSRIKHISLTDDSAGFDIASPSTVQNDFACLLEVKTSSRPGRDFRFFISRNEARIASLNENWRLVAVLRGAEGYQILGHLTYAHFSSILPSDSSPFSKWESASVTVPVDLVVPGLP